MQVFKCTENDKTNTKEYYIKILLGSKTELSVEQLTFRVDEDINLEISKAIGKKLTIRKGEYLFDNKMGKFGGIKIIFE